MTKTKMAIREDATNKKQTATTYSKKTRNLNGTFVNMCFIIFCVYIFY